MGRTTARPPARPRAETPRGAALWATLAVGGHGALYNAALGQIFAVGVAMIAAAGLLLASTGAITSATLWVVALTLPFGDILADPTGLHWPIMLASLGAVAVLLVAAPPAIDAAGVGTSDGIAGRAGWPLVVAIFLTLGVFGGPDRGPARRAVDASDAGARHGDLLRHLLRGDRAGPSGRR
ncbi:MAG: hypothetical protein AAF899_09505 [Pseudomonadota bacterium]